MADLAQLTIQIKINGAKVATNQLRALNTQAIKVSRAQVNLQDTGKRASQGLQTFGQAATNAGQSVNTVSRNSTAARTSLSSFSSSLKTVGRDLVRNFTVPLTAASAAAIMFSMDLNSGLGQVQSLLVGTLEDTTSRAEEFRDVVTNAAVETGLGFENLTTGLYETVSAFQDTTDTIGIFEIAARAASAGGATTQESIRLLSAVTKAYGDTSTEAVQQVADLAFETVRLGQTTFPQLASAMQIVTATSERLGLSQEELFSSFATLTGVTGDAAQVATQLRSINASLLNPTEALTEALSQYGTVQEAIQKLGFHGTLIEISNASEQSGRPLQDYIRRIEGINGAATLTNAQLESFISRFDQISDSAGALDTAFERVDQGINAAGRTFDRLRQRLAELAADIGQELLPSINTFLEAFINVARTLIDLFGTRVVIAFSAVLAFSGPLLIFAGSLTRAVALLNTQLAATAVTIGTIAWPVAIVAALGLGLAFLVQRLREAQRVSVELSDEQRQSIGNITNIVDLNEEQEESTKSVTEAIDDLVEAYPELTTQLQLLERAGLESQEILDNLERSAISMTLGSEIETGSQALRDRSQATINLFNLQNQLADINQELMTIEDARDTLRNLSPLELRLETTRYNELLGRSSILTQQVAAAQFRLNQTDEEYESILASLNAELEESNFILVPRGNRIELVRRNTDDLSDSTADATDSLLSWEEVFSRVTNVGLPNFATAIMDAEGTIVDWQGTGVAAANAYIESLEGAETASREFAALLGDEFDEETSLEDRIDAVADTIQALLNFPMDQIRIGEEFVPTDDVIQRLIQYRTELKALLDGLDDITPRQALDQLSDGLLNLGEMFRAGTIDLESYENAAIELGRNITNQLIAVFGGSSEEVGNFLQTLERMGIMLLEMDEDAEDMEELELISISGANVFEQAVGNVLALLNEGISSGEKFEEALGDIGTALAELSLDAAVDGFFAIGEALATGGDAGTAFGEAIGEAALAILQTLPTFFIQAGLQLIIDGQPAVGLGLIASGLALGIFSGAVSSQISTESGGTAEASAMGNVFGGPLQRFQSGGVLTNSIINTPTRFRFAQGTGVAGEAGAEAILPLTRTTTGNLGVEAVGGGTNVTVNIINNAGVEVEESTTETEEGTQVSLTISRAVSSSISNGGADSALRTRFGLTPRGTG